MHFLRRRRVPFAADCVRPRGINTHAQVNALSARGAEATANRQQKSRVNPPPKEIRFAVLFMRLLPKDPWTLILNQMCSPRRAQSISIVSPALAGKSNNPQANCVAACVRS
jgi:hypothetical protein